MSASASKKRPSSNWLALQKTIPKSSKSSQGKKKEEHARKRRKIEAEPSTRTAEYATPATPPVAEPVASTSDLKNGESLTALRAMIKGETTFTEAHQEPGKFLCIDCEMVGVGIDGTESSLGRVTMVNFHGAVMLDEFVRQRERVVDYRTRYSGIREADMFKAKPFEDVQKQVADLLKNRILIGHAVHNDLKVLLLSHPRPQTRDTQYYAGKFKVCKSRYVALRNLVQQELGIAIQDGEHSSLTDARATMAVYRLHRKEWEKGSKPMPLSSKKRKKPDDETEEFPGGGRKGVSSGLSTVVTGPRKNVPAAKKAWWKELAGGSKGKISL